MKSLFHSLNKQLWADHSPKTPRKTLRKLESKIMFILEIFKQSMILNNYSITGKQIKVLIKDTFLVFFWDLTKSNWDFVYFRVIFSCLQT